MTWIEHALALPEMLAQSEGVQQIFGNSGAPAMTDLAYRELYSINPVKARRLLTQTVARSLARILGSFFVKNGQPHGTVIER